MNVSEAVASKLEVVRHGTRSSISKIKGSLLVEWMSRISVRANVFVSRNSQRYESVQAEASCVSLKYVIDKTLKKQRRCGDAPNSVVFSCRRSPIMVLAHARQEKMMLGCASNGQCNLHIHVRKREAVE